jgi:hypothetical protein
MEDDRKLDLIREEARSREGELVRECEALR